MATFLDILLLLGFGVLAFIVMLGILAFLGLVAWVLTAFMKPNRRL